MFEIKSNTLQKALLEYSIQADLVVMASADRLRGKTTRGVFGYLTRTNALEKLLENSGLEFIISDENVVHLQPKRQIKKEVDKKVHVRERNDILETITVTGSHIRRVSKSSAALITIDKEEIGYSGTQNITEHLRKFPIFFSGGALENVGGEITGGDFLNNIVSVNSFNLYGIGNNSTLVLLDGHRIAPVGVGNIIDIFGISKHAVDSIEILADGASAIYGTDAIGGVVNVILKKEFEAAESHMNFGNVTSGNFENYHLNHIIGKKWDIGYANFSYGYHKRHNLTTNERNATKGSDGLSDILGKSSRQEFLGSIYHQVSNRSEIYFDGYFSFRENEHLQNYYLFDPSIWKMSVSQYRTVIGSLIDINSDWNIDTSALYSESRSQKDRISIVNSNFDSTCQIKNSLMEIKSVLNGRIFGIFGSNANVALGGAHRIEKIKSSTFGRCPTGEPIGERGISAYFIEFNVPITTGYDWFDKLEITLSVRHEKYDDIDEIVSPRYGVLWSPSVELSIHTTFSQSFRAPRLYDLYVATIYTEPPVLVIEVDSNGNLIPVLSVSNSTTLKSEKAEQWTIRANYSPAFMPNIDFNITYFTIDYFDKISNLKGDRNFLGNILIDKSYEYTLLRNPGMDLINYYTSLPDYENHANIDNNKIKVLFYSGGLRNVSLTRERGLNFSLSYVQEAFGGDISLKFNAVYLFELKRKLFDNWRFSDFYNAPYQPVDFKLRGSFFWKKINIYQQFQ